MTTQKYIYMKTIELMKQQGVKTWYEVSYKTNSNIKTRLETDSNITVETLNKILRFFNISYADFFKEFTEVQSNEV